MTGSIYDNDLKREKTIQKKFLVFITVMPAAIVCLRFLTTSRPMVASVAYQSVVTPHQSYLDMPVHESDDAE